MAGHKTGRPEYIAVLEQFRKLGETATYQQVARLTNLDARTVGKLYTVGLAPVHTRRIPAYPPIMEVITGRAQLPDAGPIPMGTSYVFVKQRGPGRPRKYPRLVPGLPVGPGSMAPGDYGVATAAATLPTPGGVPLPVPTAPVIAPTAPVVAPAWVPDPEEAPAPVPPAPEEAPEPVPPGPEPASAPASPGPEEASEPVVVEPEPARPATRPETAELVPSTEYISETERQKISVDQVRKTFDVADTIRNAAKGLSVSATKVMVALQPRIDRLLQEIQKEIECGSRPDAMELLKQLTLAGRVIKAASEINRETVDSTNLVLGGPTETVRLTGQAQPVATPKDAGGPKAEELGALLAVFGNRKSESSEREDDENFEDAESGGG